MSEMLAEAGLTGQDADSETGRFGFHPLAYKVTSLWKQAVATTKRREEEAPISSQMLRPRPIWSRRSLDARKSLRRRRATK